MKSRRIIKPAKPTVKTYLFNLAHARSSDRGDVLDIGVVARAPQYYPILEAQLTAARVKGLFGDWCRGPVTRYELPKLNALSFVLDEALDGGALASLRLDTQGRSYAHAVLRLEIEVPADLEIERLV